MNDAILVKEANISKGSIIKPTEMLDIFPGNGAQWCDSAQDILVYAIAPSPESVAIYKNINNSSFKKIGNTSVSMQGLCVSISRDSNYIVSVGTSASPYIVIYKRNGDYYTKLANPSLIPSYGFTKCFFDPTDTYLLCLCNQINSDGLFWIYKRNGDIFTKLTISNFPTPKYGLPSATFIPGTNYLMISMYDNDILIYERSGDTFTLRSEKLTVNTQINSIAMDYTGTYLTVSHATGLPNYGVQLFKRSGLSFVKLQEIILGTYYSCFDNTGTILIVCVGTGEFQVFKRTGDSFSKLAITGASPQTSVRRVTFSSDNKLMFISKGSFVWEPYGNQNTIYVVNGGSYIVPMTNISDPGTIGYAVNDLKPNEQGEAIVFTKLNDYK